MIRTWNNFDTVVSALIGISVSQYFYQPIGVKCIRVEACCKYVKTGVLGDQDQPVAAHVVHCVCACACVCVFQTGLSISVCNYFFYSFLPFFFFLPFCSTLSDRLCRRFSSEVTQRCPTFDNFYLHYQFSFSSTAVVLCSTHV